VSVYVCVCVCVCVCALRGIPNNLAALRRREIVDYVCKRERARERNRENGCVSICVRAYVCVCECVYVCVCRQRVEHRL